MALVWINHDSSNEQSEVAVSILTVPFSFSAIGDTLSQRQTGKLSKVTFCLMQRRQRLPGHGDFPGTITQRLVLRNLSQPAPCSLFFEQGHPFPIDLLMDATAAEQEQGA